MKIKINSLDDTYKLSKLIVKNRKKISPFILLLKGELGTGKTQMAKFIGKNLKIKEKIKSPTFNIVKIYEKRNFKLTHIDAYRLENSNSNIGLDELILNSNFVIIEWPFFIEKFIPDRYLLVNIKTIKQNKREVTIEAKGKEYKEVAKEIGNKWKN